MISLASQLRDFALAKYEPLGLEEGSFALTIAGIPRRLRRPWGGQLRGQALHYPASVVKLFYMAASYAFMDEGRLAMTPELKRALTAMIRISSNDATAYIVDLLTGTTGGPELPLPALKRWLHRRACIGAYFHNKNWPELLQCSMIQKTWEDSPYGRESQSRLLFPNTRNQLSTNAIARLLWAIWRSEIGTAISCKKMRALMSRNIMQERKIPAEHNQITGFFGEGLPRGAKLWSKAGWTSWCRHDAAVIELPRTGRTFILVALLESEAMANNQSILPDLAREACRLLSRPRATAIFS